MISYNLKTSALLAAILFVSPSSVSFARLCGGGTKHTKQGIERKLNLSSPNHRHDVQNRIVGGVDATGREFSFMVNWEEQCGGSLIAPNMVLTAAHCAPITGNSVRVGSHQLTTGGEMRQVIAKRPHPKYSEAGESVDFDFLIMMLDRPVDTTKYPVVQLNSNAAEPRDNEMLTVVGFGATSEGGEGSNILQKLQVPANPHSVCAQQYGGVQRDIHLCAGFTAGGKDSCQGDSGGPIVEMQGSTPVQVGVVSYGEGCARPNKSGVYARVSGAYEWIQTTMKDLNNNGSGGGDDDPNPISPTSAPAAPVSTPTGGDDAPVGGFAPTTGGGGNQSPTFDADIDDSPTFGTPTFDGSGGGGGGGYAPNFSWDRRALKEKSGAF